MRVSAILAQKVGTLACDIGEPSENAPVPSKTLRVFKPYPGAMEVLSYRRLESNTASRSNRVAGAAKKRPRQSAVGSKVKRIAPLRHVLACVAADEREFSCLPLALDHVKHIFVSARRTRCEITCFALERQPRERHSHV